jgi:hypothetical protein
MQAGNNRLQIVSVAAVWHERCHIIYLWDASVCQADYRGHQFERRAYCVYNASQENPPDYPIIQNAIQTDMTLGLCYRYSSMLSVFFVHENAVNTKLMHTNDAHMGNRRVTSAAITPKHKPSRKRDICVLTAMLLEVQAF